MKQAILLIGMLVAGNILFGQEKHPPREIPETKIEKLKERLELTDEQVREWKEMEEKYRPELKEIRNDDSKERHEKMRAAADVMEKQQEELTKILTEDQFTELQIIREEVKRKKKKRRKRGN